jgi:predicted flap endonuclease-1-like 5' DNA nuclease
MILLQIDFQSRPVAIAEILILMALVAFIGWLIARWTMSGRINALREAIDERRAELDECQAENQGLEFSTNKVQVLINQDIASKPTAEPALAMPEANAYEIAVPEPTATPDVTLDIVSGADFTPDSAPNIPVPVPIESVEDNLKKIEGIGPKIEQLLKAEGIKTFAKLAATNPDVLYEYLKAAGPRFQIHSPATWPEQAALARDGKWDELKVLQDSLNGGKV